MSYDAFVLKHRIGITNKSTATNPNLHSIDDTRWANSGAHHWRSTLQTGRRRLTVCFSQGSAHHAEPTAAGVLGCLMSDARGVDQTFERWCNDLRFDPDSRRAYRTYRVIQVQTAWLQQFLGAARFREASQVDMEE
jgi:hypothetical protein